MATTRAPVLTPTTRALTWSLHLLISGLLALVAVRALIEDAPHARGTVVAAGFCLAVYAVGQPLHRRNGSQQATMVWLGAVVLAWVVVLVLSAEAIWVAFPLYFLQLHLLPRRPGLVAVLVTAVAAIAAFAAHQGEFAVAMVLGPMLGAAVAVAVVWGYEALYQESEQRRRLIEELTAARADLAAAQHEAGVLAERERLAREIHDTLAQGLSSIQLLLRAAERALPDTLEQNVARYIEQARQAAVDSLGEARRFVVALSPPGLEGTTLPDALERLCRTTAQRHGLDVSFAVRGTPAPLAMEHEVALLRIVQSALSNVVQHANAAAVEVALGYDEEQVTVSVVDDGVGFDASQLAVPDPHTGGFGLVAMRARAQSLGGVLSIDSRSGKGAAITARLPRVDRGFAGSEVVA